MSAPAVGASGSKWLARLPRLVAEGWLVRDDNLIGQVGVPGLAAADSSMLVLDLHRLWGKLR